jgi:hypothetical protein
MNGYLYIITNTSFPGWVKVGTTGNLNKRLQTYQTGTPFRNYKLEFSLSHPEYKIAEKKIKDTMSYFAKSTHHEWYEVDLNIAKSRLIEQLDEYMTRDTKNQLL